MGKHGKRKGIADTKGHGFSASHQRHNRCLLFMSKSIPSCLMPLDVRNWELLDANQFCQEVDRQILSDTAMSFPQHRTSKGCITHGRHE
jgi:hypothetical protein